MKLRNKYYLLRHGEAVSNVKVVISCWPEKFHNPLTRKGVAKIKNVAKELQGKNIDLIFSSPLLRTKETAGIVANNLDLKVKYDKRLRELEVGAYNGKPVEEFLRYFKDRKERITKAVPKGENYSDVLERIFDFLKDINKKYKGKTILIVSHQAPLLLLLGKVNGNTIAQSTDGMVDAKGEKKITKGELIALN